MPPSGERDAQPLESAYDYRAATFDTLFNPLPRGVYVGIAGNLATVNGLGQTVTFYAIAGYHWIRPSKLLTAGTDATELMLLY